MRDMLNVDPQLFWSIALSILSAVLVIVSVAVSVATLCQNSRMIEASSRPYIGVSSIHVNNGSPQFLIMIKNYGASAGLITRFECSKDLADFSLGHGKVPLLEGIEGTTFMPGQKIVLGLDFKKLEAAHVRSLSFSIGYQLGKKSYDDTSVVGVSMSGNLVRPRVAGGRPLKDISYALQAITEELG